MTPMLAEKEVLTIPRFNRIPFLFHGFGTSQWRERDFKKVEGWENFRILSLEQVHSDVVHFIEEIPSTKLRGDALVTALPSLFLVVKSADCLPVLLLDKRRRVIAAAHCGWRGTLLRLLEKVVLGMKVHYGSSARDLLVALGPCISPDCYEVGEEVRQRFADEHFPASLFRHSSGKPSRYFLDLREANRFQLRHQAVPAANIFSLPICPHCNPRFPSLRRDKENTGRMLSFIALSA